MIETFSGEAAEAAAKRDVAGLYIVQSDDDARYFRVGESASLRSRTKTHGGKSGLKDFADPNFCQIHRPWIARWVAVLPTAHYYARLVCENMLTAEIGSRYPMVAGSSFEATPDSCPELISLAEALKRRFAEVISVQTNDRHEKRRYRAELLSSMLTADR